jgi:hypothetical protein
MRSHNYAELVSSRSIQQEKEIYLYQGVMLSSELFRNWCPGSFLSDGTDDCRLALTTTGSPLQLLPI